MTILVEEKLSKFLESNLPKLAPGFPRYRYNCAKCGNPVEIPIIAKREDIEAFKRLLSIAEIYLTEKGVVEKMEAEIANKINGIVKIN